MGHDAHLGLRSILLLCVWIIATPVALGSGSRPTEFTPGLTALTDLGRDTYLGARGGLYPGGSNQRPSQHETAGKQIAENEISPLDPRGRIDLEDGRIVLASLGMSNTTQEFSHFVPLLEENPRINPALLVVDGAQSGKAALAWADPDNECWAVFAQRLSDANASGEQLQVVWIKLATRKREIAQHSFPKRAMEVLRPIRTTIQNLKQKYPSVKIVYLSSRIYGGYANSELNPEPFAYETGFAIKWLVEQEIDRTQDHAGVRDDGPLPWISWGPYLWANGLGADEEVGGVPGRRDGLEWRPSDLGADGTHPSRLGRKKVAQMLMGFLESDPTATPWFLSEPSNAKTSKQEGVHSSQTELKSETSTEPLRVACCDPNESSHLETSIPASARYAVRVPER